MQVLQYTEKDWLKMKQHMEFECQNRVMSVSKDMSEKMNQLNKDHEEILNKKEAEYKKNIEELETKLQKASTEQNESTKRITDMK